MPQVCTMCQHPNYREIVRDLKSGMKRAEVVRKYRTKEHPLSPTSVKRCFDENLHHYRSPELTKAQNDLATTEARYRKEAEKDHPDVMELARLQRHMLALRKEITEYKAVLDARVEAISSDTPVTIEGLDKLIQKYLDAKPKPEWDGMIQKVGDKLRFANREILPQLCHSILELIDNFRLPEPAETLAKVEVIQ